MSVGRQNNITVSEPNDYSNAKVMLHPHALERVIERGCTMEEVIDTVRSGEQFLAKFGRQGFRKNFSFEQAWRGKYYSSKQVEVFAVKAAQDWLVLTVITRYF